MHPSLGSQPPLPRLRQPRLGDLGLGLVAAPHEGEQADAVRQLGDDVHAVVVLNQAALSEALAGFAAMELYIYIYTTCIVLTFRGWVG